MFSRLFIFIVLVSAALTALIVHADGPASSTYDPKEVVELKTAITQELTQKLSEFSAPKIELGVIKLVSGNFPKQIQSVTLQSENALGQAQFAVYGTNGEIALVLSDYAAWVKTYVANRRVTPGERLSPDEFSVQAVNIATGMAYQQRGVLLSAKEDLSRLESRQSIFEGQSLVSNAVERVPDVRRGDSVRIRVVSGSMNLSTIGVAAEPAYNNNSVKVVTSTTHRELTGILKAGGIVEVKL